MCAKIDTETNVSGLRLLLGSVITGRPQSADGNYNGQSRKIADDDWHAHFTGEATVAVDVVIGGKTRFVAIDVDDRWPQRRSLIAPVVRKLGLEDASILTSGSDRNRGKLLVFFDRPRAAASARKLGMQILAEAKQLGSSWGIERPGSVTVFPLGGCGGVVRIGGRNRRPDRRAEAVDVFYSFDGERRSLADVVPARRITIKTDPVPITPAPVGSWFEKIRRDGLTYQNGSKKVTLALCRGAAEMMRVHGSDLGRIEFQRWAADVWDASPAMHGVSPSGDPRAERSWRRRCEFSLRWASLRNRKSVTLSHPGGDLRQCNTPERVAAYLRQCNTRAATVFAVLASYASRKGLTPDAFAISYREIAGYAGLSQPIVAHRHVARLVALGRLVIHCKGTKGERGLPTLLGLVLEGETVAEVIARAEARPNLRERRRVVENYQRRRNERSRAAERAAA